MFHQISRKVLKWYARSTKRLHVLPGHEEFVLCDAVDGVTNASKCDDSSLLIAVRGNPYEISMAAVGHRLNFRRLPVGATFFSPPVHDRSPGRYEIPAFQRREFYQFHGSAPSHPASRIRASISGVFSRFPTPDTVCRGGRAYFN